MATKVKGFSNSIKSVVDALGLNGQKVTKIVLTFNVIEFPTAEITTLIFNDATRKVSEVVSMYYLTEKQPKGNADDERDATTELGNPGKTYIEE